MKKNRYTEEQIIGVLKQMEAAGGDGLGPRAGGERGDPVHVEEQVRSAGDQ